MTATVIQPVTPLRDELRRFADRAKAPRIRTMCQFAESELIIPDGPFEGMRFNTQRQPYTALWLDAVDSGRFRRFATSGPTQSGKTLLACALPVMYGLFELRETVIFGVPSGDMIKDKWQEDLLPAIEASRYREHLPRSGGGARGGTPMAIRFRNGRTLRFMTGGGNDQTRAAFTGRILVVTEADGLDEPGVNSREADKLSQLEGRTRAYADRAMIFLECTMTTTTGRINREITEGSNAVIHTHCPHCKHFVAPEREHFVGWQDAVDVIEAQNSAAFICPACGAQWSEQDRKRANRNLRLVHDGQTIDTATGEVTGDPRPTDTLGFRWSAAHNLFTTAAVIGADEWRARRDPDEFNATKKVMQQIWARPVDPPAVDLTDLDASTITQRITSEPRGHIPANAEHFAVGLDLGQRVGHYALIATRPDGSPHIVDNRVIEIASDTLGVKPALLAALRDFRDHIINPGFPVIGATTHRIAQHVFIDSRWETSVVHAFCIESNALLNLPAARPRYLPTLGYGASQDMSRIYKRPGRKSATVALIGDGYHIVRQTQPRLRRVDINADHWKSHLHACLHTPLGRPGAMTLFHADPHTHFALAKHLTAEKQTQEFVAGKGLVERWVKTNPNNHWLDAAALACCANHLAGARITPAPGSTPGNPASQTATAPGGASGGGGEVPGQLPGQLPGAGAGVTDYFKRQRGRTNKARKQTP